MGFLIQTAYKRTVPVSLQKRHIVPTYRTRTTTKKAYRTSVLYFLAEIEVYHTVLPSLMYCSNFWEKFSTSNNRVSDKPHRLRFCLCASWLSGNAFVFEAGGLRFKFPAGQIGHRVANGLPPLRISSKEAVLPGHNDAEMGLANSLHASAST